MAWFEEKGAFEGEAKISGLGTGDWKGNPQSQ